jgi:hypothetical protein
MYNYTIITIRDAQQLLERITINPDLMVGKLTIMEDQGFNLTHHSRWAAHSGEGRQ